jgi:biopolymer transport protein ExbB/TolQ
MNDRTITVRVPESGTWLLILLSAAALTVASIALWRTRHNSRDDSDTIGADMDDLREERMDLQRQAEERHQREANHAERRLRLEEAKEARLSRTRKPAEPGPHAGAPDGDGRESAAAS